MGIFNRKKESGTLNVKGFSLPFLNFITGGNYSEERALKYSAVYAAVRLLTDTVSTLPLHLYEADGDKRRIVTDHPLSDFIRNPNPNTPRNVLLETLHGHLELRGKAYAEIVHNPQTGYPVRLNIINPDNIENKLNENTGEIEYLHLPSGVIVPSFKMLHLIGYGWTGN